VVQAFHDITVEVSSSSLVMSPMMAGNETVDFELCVWQDVRYESSLDPIDVFLEESVFCRTIFSLLTGLSVLSGDICVIRDDLENKLSVEGVLDVLKNTDLTPDVFFQCITPDDGLSQVEAKVSGRTNIASLRAMEPEIIDRLSLDIVTPVCTIHTNVSTV
jgi:hypothetical protein